MRARLPLLALCAVAVLAACGSNRSGDELDASTLPNVGLGEASHPSVSFSGWQTDVKRHTVPLSEFQPGGPGRDGIPAIDRPRFTPAAEVGFLEPREPVVQLTVSGVTRAYPLQILIWHEIVNDRIGGLPVAVTFCPLCNTALAFDRRVRGRVLDFGTTGNLRDSDLVMYDRQTESWWQQFGGAGLVGRYAGARLAPVPARIVAWSEFRAAHPRGAVLNRDTGFSRAYGENPYPGYDAVDSSPLFPTRNSTDRRLPPKERVVFVEVGGESVVVPFSTLERRREVRVRVGRHELLVRAAGRASSALDGVAVAGGRLVTAASVTENGRAVAFDEPFWFAVAAFRPGARIVR